MRRIIRTTGIAAATFVLAVGVAGATDRDEQSPEGRAYLGFSFGGEKAAPRNLHYGLRLDQDSRFADEGSAMPSLMQIDFTRRGLNDARVNGLSVLKQQYRLRQAEEEAAEPAAEPAAEEGAVEAVEEEGFFEGMFSGVADFFGGLFGGDEEEAAEETAEAAEETAEEAPEELAEGVFMGYNAIDWGLLAVGAVGIGFIGSEVSNGDEDVSPKDSDGDGIPDEEEPPPPPCTINPNPLDPDGTPNGCTPTFAGQLGAGSAGATRIDPEYQEWLDGGTGQMGDLGD